MKAATICHKHYVFGLILALTIGLSSCGGQVVATPTPNTPPIVNVVRSNQAPEKTVVRIQDIPQNNCGGNQAVTNEIETSYSVSHSLDLGGGISVNASGEASIPGFAGVQVGTEVATQYGVNYGSVETISRKLLLSASGGTNLLHKIRHVEIWDKGDIVILVSGKEMGRYPYRFRTDFNTELLESTPISCSSTGSDSVEQNIDNLLQTARQAYGPISGELKHEEGKIKVKRAPVNIRNFVAKAHIFNPYDGTQNKWTYGFSFKRSRSADKYVIYDFYVRSDGSWNLRYYSSENPQAINQTNGKTSNLNLGTDQSNTILLAVQERTGVLLINGIHIATVDLVDEPGDGDISIVEGYEVNDDMPGVAVTRFEDFTIWSLDL